jgi:Uma2 family endonuclease
MTALPHRPKMSVEEYLQLDRNSEARYEFIDGHVYMLAGGTANHSIISANIIREFSTSLRGSSCRVYTSDMRVCISETRYVYPDASVSCDLRDRGTVDILRYPRLVIEVLSPSTEAYDRGKKFGYYRTCPTIQEYALVDSQRPVVEVFRRERNNFWVYHAFEPGDEVELVSLGVNLSVSAIYEDVTFPPEDDNLA